MQTLIEKFKTWKRNFDRRNEEYYIKSFQQMDEGKKFFWNWAAFFLGPIWCAYRKMYSTAIAFILLPIFFTTIGVFGVGGSSISQVYYRVYTILMFVLAGSANRTYYDILKKKIQKGYHLIDGFSPITPVFLIFGVSVVGSEILFLPVAIFFGIDYYVKREYFQHHKISSKDLVVNEENIRRYLDSNKKANPKYKIASWIVMFMILIEVALTYEEILEQYRSILIHS
mgnify:CR=1 FL=1